MRGRKAVGDFACCLWRGSVRCCCIGQADEFLATSRQRTRVHKETSVGDGERERGQKNETASFFRVMMPAVRQRRRRRATTAGAPPQGTAPPDARSREHASPRECRTAAFTGGRFAALMAVLTCRLGVVRAYAVYEDGTIEQSLPGTHVHASGTIFFSTVDTMQVPLFSAHFARRTFGFGIRIEGCGDDWVCLWMVARGY